MLLNAEVRIYIIQGSKHFFLAMTLSWKVNVLIIPSMRPETKKLTKSFNWKLDKNKKAKELLLSFCQTKMPQLQIEKT